jgi:uridine kinase
MYLQIRAYLNSRLCLNLKAICEELSEIVSGSTASSPDTDVVYIRKHGPVRSDGRVKFRKQSVNQSLKAIGEELSEIVSGSTASSPDVEVRIYLKIRAYLNSKLCLNLKAIGEEFSEIVSGFTASSPDTDVVYIQKRGPVGSEGRVKFRKQSVNNVRSWVKV